MYIYICCSTHTTIFYLAFQQKKFLLSILDPYLNFIMHALLLNELSASVFIVYNFLGQFEYFARVWLHSFNFY